MSSPGGEVRSRRKRPGGTTVAVTRAAAPFAGRLLEAFLAAGAHGVGLDSERGADERAEWRIADLDTPAVLSCLDGVDALVHAAVCADLAAALAEPALERRQRLVREAQTLTTAAAAAGVRHLVVVSSAMTYGARPGNPVPLPERAPLATEPDEGLVGDLLGVEEVLLAARSVHPGLRVSVVRPAALVGPEVDTVITRHFEAPRLLVLKGVEPAWQFCHVDDLASAVVRVVHHGLGPVVTVGSEGWLSQAAVEQLSGMRRVELSESAAQGAAQRLHRIGVLPAPASDLAFVTHPWVVDSATLRADGWRPAYDNETCLGVLLDGIKGHHAVAARRLDRKEAALGAASAAVALVGTAAIMRRRRRKGGGA